MSAAPAANCQSGPLSCASPLIPPPKCPLLSPSLLCSIVAFACVMLTFGIYSTMGLAWGGGVLVFNPHPSCFIDSTPP